MSDRIMDELEAFMPDADDDTKWDEYRRHYVTLGPAARLSVLQHVDETHLDGRMHITKEFASLVQRRRELVALHSQLRRSGR